jgi:hypothetical protein
MWVQSTDFFLVKFLVFLSSISRSFLSLHISLFQCFSSSLFHLTREYRRPETNQQVFFQSMFFFFIFPLHQRRSTTYRCDETLRSLNLFLNSSIGRKNIGDIWVQSTGFFPIKLSTLLTFTSYPFFFSPFFLIFRFYERILATYKSNQQAFFQSNS